MSKKEAERVGRFGGGAVGRSRGLRLLIGYGSSYGGILAYKDIKSSYIASRTRENDCMGVSSSRETPSMCHSQGGKNKVVLRQ